MKHPKFLHPANAEELATIAHETGAELLRGALRYPSESGGWQVGPIQKNRDTGSQNDNSQTCRTCLLQ